MKEALSLILVITFTTTGKAQSPNGHSQPPNDNKFTINGKLSGFSDSTLLYLEASGEGTTKPMDSTYVINDQFHFTGSINAEVMQAVIRTSRFTDYRFFWLENAPITFTAEKTKLSEALITGSRSEEEQKQMNNAMTGSGNAKAAEIEFIKGHPNSIVSVNVLSVFAPMLEWDTTAMLYRNLSDKMKNTSYGKKIKAFLEKYKDATRIPHKDIKVGDKYIDFAERDTAGKKVSLSDYKGKIVLLEFWASWCTGCREDNPELVKTYQEYHPKGFEIMGVSADYKKAAWLKAIRKDGLPWKNVSDLKGDANKAAYLYGISKYPSNFLIDGNGNIIAIDLRGKELTNKLAELFH